MIPEEGAMHGKHSKETNGLNLQFLKQNKQTLCKNIIMKLPNGNDSK